jgi:hypothetical protein
MKTIFKSALVMCIALTVGLAGCQKDQGGNGGVDKDAKTVVIKIAKTRAEVAPIDTAGEEVAKLNDAWIYFTSGTSVVDKYEIIFDGAEPAVSDLANKKVAWNKLDGEGEEFVNLPASINHVYFVGNSPVDYNQTNMATFNVAATIALSTQKEIDDVALYGDSGLTAVAANATNPDNTHYTAQINVEPVVARFEIGAISATAAVTEGELKIATFSLKGIYLDNYIPTMAFDGSANGAAVKAEAPVEASDFAGTYAAEVSDIFTTGYEGAITYSPASNNVWGYNLLAPEAAPMPYVIIRISNVLVEGETAATPEADRAYPGEWFLTVQITPATIDNRRVYSIDDIEFNASDLTKKPFETKIDVTVTVDILPWIAATAAYEVL